MVRDWQLWLSPRPSRRTVTPTEPRMYSVSNAALYEFLNGEDNRLVVRETHYAGHPDVRAGLSGPPLHIHLRQTEFFEVEKGSLVVTKNEQEHVLTKEDGVAVITPGTRHRFWAHPSNEEDLVFKVWAEPHGVDRGFDENYLRNALGYLRDCQAEGLKPSIFQFALFGCLSDTVFTPPFWTPIWLLKYKETYPEYSRNQDGERNEAKKSA